MPAENRILASIPDHEKRALLPKLEGIVLRKPEVICETEQFSEYAYFPTGGLLSLLSVSEEGDLREIAAVTREGFIGPPILSDAASCPFQIVVRITGRAFRIRTRELLRACKELPGLQAALLEQTQEFVRRVCARVACHHSHTPIQRLSGWLLTVRRAIDADDFELTHETLALSLSLDRSIVTRAALELYNRRILSYHNGHVTIHDVRALQATACSCEQASSHGSDSELSPTRRDRTTATPRLS